MPRAVVAAQIVAEQGRSFQLHIQGIVCSILAYDVSDNERDGEPRATYEYVPTARIDYTGLR